MAGINPYYRRKVRVQKLGFKELEGVIQNEGTVRINLTDGAAFLYDSLQDFTPYALPSGVTGKGARRYKAYIYQGDDVICGFLDVEGAGETLGTDLAVNGTFASDANWTKGTGWTIGTGVATKAAGDASDLVAGADIVGTRGQLYKVTCDIALTAGTLVVKRGESLGSELAVNGAFASDANWTKGTGWTIGTGVATKAAGDASDLVAAADIAGTCGQLYKVTCDIALTAGTLVVKAGSLVLGTITPENDGTGLTFYFTNNGTNFKPTFSADAECAGTVDNVVIKAVTAAAANVSVKLFAAQVAGSQNIEGGLTSVPTNFDCSAADLTYKIIPLF